MNSNISETKSQIKISTAVGEIVVEKPYQLDAEDSGKNPYPSFQLEPYMPGNNLRKIEKCVKSRICKLLQNKKVTTAWYSALIYITADYHVFQNAPDDAMRNGEFYLGWDTEYVRAESGNKILSYQFYSWELGKGLILFPSGGQLPLNHLIELLYWWLKEEIPIKPKHLHLVAHFSKAELFSSSLRDAAGDWLRVADIQKNLVTLRPCKYVVRDVHRNKYEVLVSIHDTFLLSGKAPLAVIAQSLGRKKVEIGDWISKMDRLLAENPAKFIEYAMYDSVIAVEYFKIFHRRSVALTGDANYVPVTASGLSERIVLNKLGDAIDFVSPRDIEERTIAGRGGKWRTEKVEVLPEVLLQGRRCYYGGRNETYLRGWFEGSVFDYDLKDAYPTSLLCLSDIDWDNYEQIKIDDDISWQDIGYIELAFKFKPEVQFPLFPVLPWDGDRKRTDLGLCFPRSGRSTVTFPEFFVAKKYGLLSWFKVIDTRRFKRLDGTALADCVQDLILDRRKYPKGTFENLLLKLVNNSVYGKTCQGLRRKSSINLRKSIESEEIVRNKGIASRLYNPYIAAYTTGLCRALVGEYLLGLNRSNRSQDAVCVTTDGFMVRGPALPESYLKGKNFRLAGQVCQVRRDRLGDDAVLELKHASNAGVFSVKTRNYGMLPDGSDPSRLLLARGGISTKGKSPQEALDYLINAYLTCDTSYEIQRLTSLEEFLLGEEDLLNHTEQRTKNWDYDLKRKPVNIVEKEISWQGKNYRKICFESTPWNKASDFVAVRRSYADWRKYELQKSKEANSNKLQSLENFDRFAEYHEAASCSDTYTTDAEATVAKKLVWILSKQGKKGAEIAKILGYSRDFVHSKRRTKKFRDYKDGKLFLKPITEVLARKTWKFLQPVLVKVYLESDLENTVQELLPEEICDRVLSRILILAGNPEITIIEKEATF